MGEIQREESERERDSYLHILVHMKCVVQIMGIHIHETVEDISVRCDLLIEHVLQNSSADSLLSTLNFCTEIEVSENNAKCFKIKISSGINYSQNVSANKYHSELQSVNYTWV